jgi:hypothetical protein
MKSSLPQIPDTAEETVYLARLPAKALLLTHVFIDGEILSVRNLDLLDLFEGRLEDRGQLKQSKF